jgi:hypothetical protein
MLKVYDINHPAQTDSQEFDPPNLHQSLTAVSRMKRRLAAVFVVLAHLLAPTPESGNKSISVPSRGEERAPIEVTPICWTEKGGR